MAILLLLEVECVLDILNGVEAPLTQTKTECCKNLKNSSKLCLKQPFVFFQMHLKSHPKLIRSELHLDLSQQQGALRRRSGPFNNHTNQSTRLPLVELSTNALRSSNYVIATRARGIENSAMFPEDDSAPLDVWSVIKPGHVREKIALFALEGGGDRNVSITGKNTALKQVLSRS